jgi:hypothetical protein
LIDLLDSQAACKGEEESAGVGATEHDPSWHSPYATTTVCLLSSLDPSFIFSNNTDKWRKLVIKLKINAKSETQNWTE